MSDMNHRSLPRRAEALWLTVCFALAAVCFHFYGNSSSVEQEGRSIFRWVAQQWANAGSDFSHGWLMPLFCAGLIWWRRKRIAACDHRTDVRGILLVAGALLLHWLAYRAQQPRISLAALVGVLWGIPLALAGPALARQLAFPALYLLLCFTSSLLFYATFQLRLISTAVATKLLNGIAIEAVRRGTAIYVMGPSPFQLDVADPCSGLRSLFVITALAAPYAYFSMRTRTGKILLFALSIPLAMLANTIRIVTLGAVGRGFGVAAAMTLYHDFSGYLVFGISVLLLTSSGAVINRLLSARLPRPPREEPTS